MQHVLVHARLQGAPQGRASCGADCGARLIGAQLQHASAQHGPRRTLQQGSASHPATQTLTVWQARATSASRTDIQHLAASSLPPTSTPDAGAAPCCWSRPLLRTCTERMQTARGTLTTLLPRAAAAPAVNAVAPSLMSVRSFRNRLGQDEEGEGGQGRVGQHRRQEGARPGGRQDAHLLAHPAVAPCCAAAVTSPPYSSSASSNRRAHLVVE